MNIINQKNKHRDKLKSSQMDFSIPQLIREMGVEVLTIIRHSQINSPSNQRNWDGNLDTGDLIRRHAVGFATSFRCSHDKEAAGRTTH